MKDKVYVECITDIHKDGWNLNYVWKGEIYELIMQDSSTYKIRLIERRGPGDGTYYYSKEYFRILTELELQVRIIKEEIYGR